MSQRRSFLHKLMLAPFVAAGAIVQSTAAKAGTVFDRKWLIKGQAISDSEAERLLNAIGYGHALDFPCQRVVRRHLSILQKINPEQGTISAEELRAMATDLKQDMLRAFTEHVQKTLGAEDANQILAVFESRAGQKALQMMVELQRVGAPFVDRGPGKLDPL